MAVIRDMAERVAGYRDHLEAQLRRIEHGLIAIADTYGSAADAFVKGSMNRGARGRCKFCSAVDMVAMMMREQDGAQAQMLACERREYGRRLTRVHGHGGALSICEQPDNVIGERGYGNEAQVGHGGRNIASAPAADVKQSLAGRPTGYTSAVPTVVIRRVIIRSDNLFALPETGALLREELGCVGAHASRRPGGRALVLQACAANRSLVVDTRHLAAVRVHAEQGRLRGDVVCAADALPWEDDSFQLVLAQHVGDVLPSTFVIIDELARVLAPGGVLLWCGLNPWSPWLAWIHWRAPLGMPLPRTTHADFLRRRMSSRQLTPASAAYLGACWQFGAHSDVLSARVLAPLRRAYLLTASKQRGVLTPLRARAVRQRAVIKPQLAATPSRCARV